MRRAILGLLVVAAFVIWSARVAASGVHALRMSPEPEGPAVSDFPSGVEQVYVVFEYTDLMGERVRVVVTNYAGQVLFENSEIYTGSGVASIAVRMASGPIPDGPYVTTLYFAGDYLSQAVEWTVGGVTSPPTPTPFPAARLDVQPTALTFQVEQGEEDPPAQRVLITNHTVPASVWYAATDTSWLQLDHQSGETPALLEVGARAKGLPGALYEGHVTVTSLGIPGSPQTVTVSLQVGLPEGSVTQDLAVDPAGTGWVVAGESENHLGADEIWAGVQEGRAQLGALRVDLAALPTDSEVRAAAVVLTGLRWEAEGPGDGWVLELLDPAAIEDWAALDYAELATAPAIATLSPVFRAQDLSSGVTYFWVFDEAGLAALQTVLADPGEALFRLRGPDAGEDALFVWDASGVLRVNFVSLATPEATPTLEPEVTATSGPATTTPTVTLTPIRPPLAPKPGEPVMAAMWLPGLGGLLMLGVILGAVLWQRTGSR